MYCRKCGKQIDYDSPLCKECEDLETFFGETPQEQPSQPSQSAQYTQYAQAQPAQPVGSRKEGFGKALAATIMSSIAFFISLIAMTLVSEALTSYAFGYEDVEGIIGASVFMSMLCLGLSIPSLIMGIQSMKCFFRAKNAGRLKPVPTLVCGIVGVVMSALTFLYVFLIIAMGALV